MKLKRIVIVGAGGVGGAIAGLLHQARVPVLLVARGAHLAALRTTGLTLRRPAGTTVLPLAATQSPDWRAGDLALLCVKSQDTALALSLIPSHIPVVCAQNGIQNEVLVAQTHDTVVGMLTGIYAVHLTPGEVDLHDAGCPGLLDVGTISGDETWGQQLSTALQSAGFLCAVRPDIMAWKRAKLVSNLPGILSISVGAYDRELAWALIDEGRAVMAAAGLNHPTMAVFKELMSVVRHSQIDGVSRPGGSLWQSKQRGSSSEVGFLNGHIVSLGRTHEVPTPENERLLDGVTA